MSERPWPDYCKRETLAKRLNLAVGAIDQLVSRGLLPPPVDVGGAKLWRWADVDSFLSARKNPEVVDDPYSAGARRAAEAASARPNGPKQARAPVLLSAETPGNR